MLNYIAGLGSAVIAIVIGYFYRDLSDKIKALQQKKQEPEVGATPGSYHRQNEYNTNQDSQVGISSPKTPQQLEWEEELRLREEQLKR